MRENAEAVPALPLRDCLIQLERVVVRLGVVKVFRIVANGTFGQKWDDNPADQIR
jgi:hypothetical protein